MMGKKEKIDDKGRNGGANRSMEYRDALLERFERMAKPSNEIKTIVKYREIPSIFAAVNGQPEDRTVGRSANISPFIPRPFCHREERNEDDSASNRAETNIVAIKICSLSNEKTNISDNRIRRLDLVRLTRNRQAHEGSNTETRPFFHA